MCGDDGRQQSKHFTTSPTVVHLRPPSPGHTHLTQHLCTHGRCGRCGAVPQEGVLPGGAGAAHAPGQHRPRHWTLRGYVECIYLCMLYMVWAARLGTFGFDPSLILDGWINTRPGCYLLTEISYPSIDAIVHVVHAGALHLHAVGLYFANPGLFFFTGLSLRSEVRGMPLCLQCSIQESSMLISHY